MTGSEEDHLSSASKSSWQNQARVAAWGEPIDWNQVKTAAERGIQSRMQKKANLRGYVQEKTLPAIKRGHDAYSRLFSHTFREQEGALKKAEDELKDAKWWLERNPNDSSARVDYTIKQNKLAFEKEYQEAQKKKADERTERRRNRRNFAAQTPEGYEDLTANL